MDLLQPVIRPYAWGSRYGIAEFQGRAAPSAGPEAELWMGAHPSAPSGLERAGRVTTLDSVIAADPAAELGARCVARFGPRLPFLLKVLAADRALSIQVHPSRAQAQAGFRAENERGLPPGDPARNYPDDWPKPELLYAVTPFEVLAGLRPRADAARVLRALEVGPLRPLVARLEAASDDRVLADVLASVLQWPAPGELAAEVARACAGLGGLPYAAAARVAADFPGDPGVVALLLMRHTVLQPGQAVYMPAGGLHAYLRGTGIEVLANSDNVVRAGLTGKHVDVPELLRLVDPAVEVPVLSPPAVPGRVVRYQTPAPEFGLHVVNPGDRPVDLPGEGPRIVLCAAGAAEMHSERGDAVKLARGESCFVPAADGAVRCAGPGRFFVAGAGPASYAG
jgi:mannose-6-phosphate isomerase